MQVFTDQASHRDRVLFELRLKRKSNFMPFSVVQGGVGVPPPPPSPPPTLVLGLCYSWMRWYEYYGLWHCWRLVTSFKTAAILDFMKIQTWTSSTEISHFNFQIWGSKYRYCHTWHCGMLKLLLTSCIVTIATFYRHIFVTSFRLKVVLKKKKKKKTRKAFENGLCIPGWLPWK